MLVDNAPGLVPCVLMAVAGRSITRFAQSGTAFSRWTARL
jgi:hypothetical protein